MLVSEFDYDLPADLIAQEPPPERGASRLLLLSRTDVALADRRFTDLPQLLRPGDLLVVNDSRVIPARLFATRAGLSTQPSSPAPSGHIEVLLTERLGDTASNRWLALVKPARKVQPGERLLFAATGAGEPTLRAEVIAAGAFGERTLEFAPCTDFYQRLDAIGHLPLPPYIHRSKATPNSSVDRERYQTVYAQTVQATAMHGSAAAPTAGLHFTPEVFAQLDERGVEVVRLSLHVGLGTFQPVRAERTEAIRLHAEHYTISAETAAAIDRARRAGRRVIAVGTTTTRTLEHAARVGGGAIEAQSGSTSLFLSPGLDDEFKVVSGLLTNFHLPQSTLLMLVSAFAGRERVLAAYEHAVEERYRFFSYGDCMLIL